MRTFGFCLVYLLVRSRFLRWLVKAEGLHIDVDDEDYEKLATMGSGAAGGLETAGIENYEDAKAACSVITAASGAEYGLDDLVCFMCLSGHKEAVKSVDLPKLAPPVSVSDDLGLEIPQPLTRSAPRFRISKKKNANPLSRTPCLAMAMQELIRWAHIAAAISLSQCCRAYHGNGLFMANRRVEMKRNIADSVAVQLSPEAPAAAALLKAGVSRSTLLRTVACAWDWLEKCNPWRDENLMIVALLRLSIKFEVSKEFQDIALELVGPETKAVSAIECRLVTQLWGSGSYSL